MFGILARTLHTAARIDPPRLPERARPAPKSWNAPRHWLRGQPVTKDSRRA